MIGVIAKENEKEAVAEFFELFKTPWQFARDGEQYEVLISCTGEDRSVSAPISIVFSSRPLLIDDKLELESESCNEQEIEFSDRKIPIYGNLIAFRSAKKCSIQVKAGLQATGVSLDLGSMRMARLGYDLFYEIQFLLSVGQPARNALVPTVDHHISLLRSLILSLGGRFLEVLPVPGNYDFICCLTHDVDFFRISQHIGSCVGENSFAPVFSCRQFLYQDTTAHKFRRGLTVLRCQANDLKPIPRQGLSFSLNTCVELIIGISNHANGFCIDLPHFSVPISRLSILNRRNR